MCVCVCVCVCVCILSAYEKIFQESSKIYMDAFKNSGFREEIYLMILIKKIRSTVKK